MGTHAGSPQPGNPGYGGHGQRGVKAKGGKHKKSGCMSSVVVPVAGLILCICAIIYQVVTS